MASSNPLPAIAPPEDQQIFPNEVLLHVARHCDVETRKVLRQTASLFNTSDVNGPAFEVIHLALTHESIGKLVNISKADHLRRCVRKVIFLGTRLGESGTDSVEDEESLEGLVNDEDRLLHGGALHEECLPQQLALATAGVVAEVEAALLRLTSLSCVEMEDITNSSRQHEESFYENLLSQVGFVYALEYEAEHVENSLPTSLILKIMARTQLKLDKLKMCTNDFHDGFFQMRDYDALKNVRALSWTFVNPQYDDRDHPPFPFLVEVVKLINGATQLQELCMDVDPSYQMLDFLEFYRFQNMKLPALRVLHVSFNFSPESILGFLGNHAATLEELHFNKGLLCAMTPAAWPPLLAKIPTVCKLKQISFDTLGDEIVVERRPDRRIRDMLRQDGWRSRMVSHILNGDPVPTFDPEVWFAAKGGAADDDLDLDLTLLRITSGLTEREYWE